MTPTVAIIEPHRDLAAALREVVTLANCSPVLVDDVEELTQLPSPPSAIVVRVVTNPPIASTHLALQNLLLSPRPKVLALASSDEDVAEANRIGCDVVLREPQQVRALYDALTVLSDTRADAR